MEKIEFKDEFNFIITETHNFNLNNIPYMYRELLLIAQVFLNKIGESNNLEEKAFLSAIYFLSKNHYLKYTTKNDNKKLVE